MRKIKGLLALASCLLASTSLTSCGLFGTDEGYALSSYGTSYDEETGNTFITFYFTDEDKDPFTVTVPQALSGVDGVSILGAEVVNDEENHVYIITITYTDESVEPTVVTIPYYEGESVTEVVVGLDEEGNKTIKFVYSDGGESPLITIPSGNGIASLKAEPTESGYKITITFTNEEMEPVSFEVSNGVGIKSVGVNNSKSTPTQYCITVTYTDGTTKDFMIDKPVVNKWYYGASDPTSYYPMGSNDGDYYLNYVTGWVFIKMGTSWVGMFSMKADTSSQEKHCNILFNPNGGHFIGGSEAMIIFWATVGKTVPLESIQTPERDNYIFKGWFTNPSNPNSGQFTDVTVVTGDLTLLAKWEAI